MHLQNRVNPFGDIVAIPQRGTFTGNRGIIHESQTKTLMRRRWTNKAWLICNCEYKGRRRNVMGCQTWTELFFLDEAVALAAGHRPCFLCRHDAAEAFRSTWAKAKGCAKPSAGEIDSVLHGERLQGQRKRRYRGHRPISPICPTVQSFVSTMQLSRWSEARRSDGLRRATTCHGLFCMPTAC